MDKLEKDFMASIDSKLSLIAALLLQKEELSIKEKVALVDSICLSNKDASKVLGISESHYAKEKSLLKKKSPASGEKIIEPEKQEIQDDKPKEQQQS